MEETSKSKSSEETQKVAQGRRKLLKVLAAGGGAVAFATLLPKKWVKPVIDWGVLPLHAQVSPEAVVISNLLIEFLGPVADAAKPEVIMAPLVLYQATFDYYNSKNQVDDTSILYAELNNCGALPFSGWPLSSLTPTMVGIATWTGNSTSGKITFKFTANSCGLPDSEIKIQFKVQMDLSNQLTGMLSMMMG
jgi:hypothetical protein